MVIGKGQGCDQVQGKSRGLCHVKDCVRPTSIDEGDDTGMLSSLPPVAGKSHTSQEQSNDSPSFRVSPTASCKGIYCLFLIICCYTL
jgi:hypothetical protein